MAKKKKKNRPPDFDPNQRKRERIEARRQAKAEELERRRKAARRERLVRRVGLVVLLVLAFWFLFIRGGPPDAIAGHEIEHYSTSNGNPDHVDFDVTYDMSPPVSGQHRVQSAPCGTHGTPVEDELFVHTLEHGVVAIVYDPSLPIDDIRQIEEIVGSYPSYTLAAPYAAEMDTPIAVVAWAHIMRLDEVDGTAIREFIDVFRQGGDAPEAGDVPCPNDAEDEFQPASPAPDASPGASPAPEASPPAESPPPDRGDDEETPAP
ncbi:MAG TPA: DUF3105 domain-containing protein [Actinomycetota bacterium]|nr:DUF3105 domain-containing protein [Actinomycetota bacterium]